MRIGMISRTVPPIDRGGIQVHVRALCEGLAKLGHEVHLFISGHTEIDGVRVHPLRTFSTPGLTLGYYVSLTLSAAREAAKYDLDVVHGHSMYAFGAALKKKWPLVVTIHGTQIGEVRSQIESGHWNPNHLITDSVSAVMEGYASRRADAIIAVSKRNADEIIEHYSPPPEKVRIVPNGIWTKDYKVSDYSNPDVVFIGRLHERKGVDILVQAMPDVLSEHPDARLVLIGDGELREHLERLVIKLGIQKNVVFTGRISDEEKREILSHAMVLVMPSLYEGFGIVMLEGMASALGVVATPVGAVEEVIVNGRNGIIAEHSNLASEISSLLSDPERLKAMGRRAREDVERKYDWMAVAADTLRVYEGVAGQ